MNEYHWVENINNKIDKMIVDDKWIDSAMDFWLKQYKEKYDDWRKLIIQIANIILF